MYPVIYHIYGPININSFSLTIALGLLVFLWLLIKDKRLKDIINKEQIINITIETTIAAIIGGRILHVLVDIKNYKNFTEIVSIWNGGIAISGAVVTAIIYATWILRKQNISILSALDIAAVYAPIIHVFARIGCFLAGCCHGCPSTSWWSIVYTNPEVAAPLYTPLYPTQIYSSAIFLIIFIFMLLIYSRLYLTSGKLLMTYLMLSSIERILVDYLRGDRTYILNNIKFMQNFSCHQWIALIIFLIGFIGFIVISLRSVRSVKLKSHESV